MLPEYLDKNEVAKLLKISPRTVIKKAANGVLPGCKPGRHWLFNRDNIVSWMDDQSKVAKAKTDKIKLDIKEAIQPCRSNAETEVKFTTQTSQITAKELENQLALQLRRSPRSMRIS